MKSAPARLAHSQGGPWKAWSVAGLLALLTACIYWPLSTFDLISYDDPEYITWNLDIQSGLTLPALRWAFSTLYAGNWHPLTWVSYMSDYQWFGGSPGQMHLTNLVLHTANTILLFWLFTRMTRELWPSAIVAALFAVHPLHVESVAWVCERKDVLSTFFGLLALLAYTKYVSGDGPVGTGNPKSEIRNPKSEIGNWKLEIGNHLWFWYCLALVLFALGLMSKPMLVTLPLVLLLLDFWPLRRFQIENRKSKIKKSSPVQGSRFRVQGSKLLILLAEKLPFLVLAIADSIVTFLAQRQGGAVVPAELLPLSARFANACMAYWHYLHTACWPIGLSISYPAAAHWPAWQPLCAAALILGISAVVFTQYRRPYLVTGWFWFLGCLVPVVGIIQVGAQTIADRFMYFPLIGLTLCLAWGVLECLRASPSFRLPLVLAVVSMVALCAMLAHRQVAFWQDGLTVFERALAVCPDNFLAHDQVALSLNQLGRHDEAVQHYFEAARLNPQDAAAHIGLASSLGNQGRLQEAAAHATTALQLQPDSPEAHDCFGVALQLQHRTAEAEAHFARAVQLRPSFADARNHWAFALLQQGRTDDAIAQLHEALRFQPNSAEFQQRLSYALARRAKSSPPD